MQIQALQTSQHIFAFEGEFKCVGIYEHALNFICPQQRLITFHRQGRGLSPMGWLLKQADFDSLAKQCHPALKMRMKNNQITIADNMTLIAGDSENLRLQDKATLDLRWLESFFSLLSPVIATGLYGPLKNYRQIARLDEIKLLTKLFYHQLSGKAVNWAMFIGKGPGLTPSSDDMLVGMLFAHYLAQPEKSIEHFFNETPPLSSLTTIVSQHYLEYATRGIFSTYLIQLGKKIKNKEIIFKDMLEILSIGHHSGADTLLGLWIGYQIKQQQRID
ncbi:DUF2877 domain-containing protein [Proteus mirabilis]|uniref:DUF2877 domain-containing protein n=1 Tax=Proteus mirabilis TaxID=584 RepID=UPI00235EAACA|nr:DUF2877 domain-containing protein [Proteus mirabilis]MDC9783047.1 DUF2877 domain-containing protein [Proteus mirabilis]HCT1418284.1 DUF2877 domain-containing protein [Proteus mirabilis]HEI8457559.1 DUF2877 domain-containing protein [Proteus mirabilis]